MKKTLSILLAMVLLLTCIPMGAVSVSAATYGNLTYVVSGGKVTITDCNTSASGALTIPKTIEGYPVTAIGYQAFYWCDSLTAVSIPDSVTGIGDKAFWWCKSLTSVTIGDSVTTIGEYAFAYCDSLTSVTIGDSVTSIGGCAFRGCDSLTSVTIGDSVKSIGYSAFYDCDSLTAVTIPDSVTTIDGYAFSDCAGLTSVTIGDSVEDIYYNAFFNCQNLTKLTLPKSVTSIGSEAFAYCYNLTVYYAGSEADRQNITIDSGNDQLTDAVWYYNFNSKCYHEWENGVCTLCKEKSPTCVTVTTQPKTGYAKVGYTVSTSVKATGEGLRYEWYIKNSGQTKYSRSSIAQSTYSTIMRDDSKDRLVFCRVYDKYGNMVQTKTVRLREAVSVMVQPTSTTVASGKIAKVSVCAYGDGLTYTWYIKNEGASKYTKSSVTKSTYSCTMNSKSKNRLVYCVVKDKYGNKVTTVKVRLKMK